eukprot:11360008-Alexandrium_andersonii.AAC.1
MTPAPTTAAERAKRELRPRSWLSRGPERPNRGFVARSVAARSAAGQGGGHARRGQGGGEA